MLLGVAKAALTPQQVAIIVDPSQPESVQAGHYYASARMVPPQNIFAVNLGQRDDQNVVDNATFSAARRELWSRLGADIQALALMWAEPMRVDCQSITAAFAFGFDASEWCTSYHPHSPNHYCSLTKASPYYNSSSTRPFDDFGFRLVMMVAGASFDATQALIDRGVASDSTWPRGTGFFINTTDSIRNVRSEVFKETVNHFKDLDLRYIEARSTDHSVSPVLLNKTGVLFYFESLAIIRNISTNQFRPGAIGDTLTSVAGHPHGGESCLGLGPKAGDQTSVMCFLEAGATASYGNVLEPCNDQQKFSQTRILLESYVGGATLIESYWRSVMMPGMGVFVGEPLASPWRGGRGAECPPGSYPSAAVGCAFDAPNSAAFAAALRGGQWPGVSMGLLCPPDAPCVITGAGGGGRAPLLTANNNRVVLQNVRVRQNSAEGGGLLAIANNSAVIGTNISFVDGVATGLYGSGGDTSAMGGGCVLVPDPASSFSCTDCTFDSCVARTRDRGGKLVYLQGGGVAVAGGSVHLMRPRFLNNSCSGHDCGAGCWCGYAGASAGSRCTGCDCEGDPGARWMELSWSYCGNNVAPPPSPQDCAAMLDTLCSGAQRASTGNCLVCCEKHQPQLQAAGCTDAAADSFCVPRCMRSCEAGCYGASGPTGCCNGTHCEMTGGPHGPCGRSRHPIYKCVPD
jgi:uncharacterized protein (TIGR03790 family)